MSAFHRLLNSPDLYGALVRAQDQAGRMHVVANAKRYSITQLEAALRRVPTVPPRIAALYVARGKPIPTWNLQDNDQAVVFCLELKGHRPTPTELDMALLLRTCVLAEEAGDVPEFAAMALGKKSSAAHATAASAPRKLWANDIKKIKLEYERRVRAGEQRGAITDLAAKYKVTTKTISRHVKAT